MSTKETNPKDAIGSTKVALSLLSPIAKAAWSLAQFAGMTKYGHYNWRVTGVRMSVYLDAIDRHRDALISGEWLDPVDGTPHLGNIMACCAIILDARAAGKLIDDRPPSVCLRSTYAEVEAQMARLKVQYADKKPRHYYIEDTQVPEEWGDVNIEGCAAPDTEREITATFDGVPFPVDPVSKSEPFELVIDFKVTPNATAENVSEGVAATFRRFFESLKSADKPIEIRHPELGPRVLVTPPPAPRFREGDVVSIDVLNRPEEGVVTRVGEPYLSVTSPGWKRGGGWLPGSLTLLRRPVRVGDVLLAGEAKDRRVVEAVSVAGLSEYNPGPGFRFIDGGFISYVNAIEGTLSSLRCTHEDGTPIEPPPAIDPDAPICGAV